MFTDIVGYTALGQRNESLSLALVDEQRKLLRPIFIRHGGREVKTIGDAFLVEFPSALEAVRCAYDIQRATREFNITLPGEKRIHLRVGVHLGDVVESQGDISGDAVNVASRIEALAEDGGVCLTRQVHDQVQSKFELPLVGLGSKSLKNVSAPLEIYKMVMPWTGEETTSTSILDRKRLAVLPFVSISPDPNDEYFADGLTEELIDRLSQVRELEVIARTSIMSYKKKEKKAAEIGRELSAGTLVEGSVRKVGNKIRVTAQLIDSNTERHLWSSKYDKDLEDIFAVQSDIAEQVTQSLALELLPNVKSNLGKKVTNDIDAYLLFMKGRYYYYMKAKQDQEKAMKYYEAAIALDPAFSLAYAGISQSCHTLGDSNWLPPEVAYPRMKEYATKAIETDPALADGHAAIAAEYMHYEWKWQESEREFKRAIELNPSFAPAYLQYGNLLGILGRLEEALRNFQRGYELDPKRWVALGPGLYAMGRNDEAVAHLEKHLLGEPDSASGHMYLGIACYLSGKTESAIAELERAIALSNGDPTFKAHLAIVLGLSGRRDAARLILDDLLETSKREYVSSVLLALILHALGRHDEAFEKLELAIERRTADLTQSEMPIWTWPGFHELRQDHRWEALEKRMGF